MKRSSQLIAMPLQSERGKPEVVLPDYYPAGKPIRPELKIPASLDVAIQKFLLRHEARPLRDDAPRIHVLQSEPGTGKSHAQIAVAQARGWNVVSASASEFLGETEMSGLAALNKRMADAQLIGRVTGVRTLCVFHDIDLILGADRGEVRGPAHRVIAERLMYLASNKGEYTNADSSTTPILVNGNDFKTGVRSSVFRDGRAHFDTVSITLAEKIEMVEALLRAPASEAVRTFVTANVAEPIAFFVAVKSDLETERFNALLLSGERTAEEIEAAFAEYEPPSLEQLEAAAGAIRANRARNFTEEQ